jgi:hypothetical protein
MTSSGLETATSNTSAPHAILFIILLLSFGSKFWLMITARATFYPLFCIIVELDV